MLIDFWAVVRGGSHPVREWVAVPVVGSVPQARRIPVAIREVIASRFFEVPTVFSR